MKGGRARHANRVQECESGSRMGMSEFYVNFFGDGRNSSPDRDSLSRTKTGRKELCSNYVLELPTAHHMFV